MARGRRGRRSKEYLAFDPYGHTCAICGLRPATSRDHVPPLALHQHIEGSGCCSLRPACMQCQGRQGQQITKLINIERARRIREVKQKRYGAFAKDPSVY